jgi:hypothetical protein
MNPAEQNRMLYDNLVRFNAKMQSMALAGGTQSATGW